MQPAILVNAYCTTHRILEKQDEQGHRFRSACARFMTGQLSRLLDRFA